jgi:ADP-ribose pyrophosphatase YjhB (NUDIX family)
MEKSNDLRKIQYYLGEKAKYSDYQSTTRALIELLAPYTHTAITELDVKLINGIIEEHRLKCLYIKEFILVCSENSRDELRKYIDDLEYTVELLQEAIERYQQKIEELMKPIPPPPTPEETNRRLREMIDETDKELFSKLLPFLLRRAEELRKTVSCHDCSLSLLQNICSILKLDDREAISRLNKYFENKTREQILSDHGLVIILAISNISGYSGEYERSMNGNFWDDKSMFDELFVEDPNFGLVRFPSLLYRAFENPFIQSALPIKNESTRETLETSLRCMNAFARRLNDINQEVLLTMDCSSVSSDERRMLFADRYFLWVPDIWHVLSTLSE